MRHNPLPCDEKYMFNYYNLWDINDYIFYESLHKQRRQFS